MKLLHNHSFYSSQECIWVFSKSFLPAFLGGGGVDGQGLTTDILLIQRLQYYYWRLCQQFQTTWAKILFTFVACAESLEGMTNQTGLKNLVSSTFSSCPLFFFFLRSGYSSVVYYALCMYKSNHKHPQLNILCGKGHEQCHNNGNQGLG